MTDAKAEFPPQVLAIITTHLTRSATAMHKYATGTKPTLFYLGITDAAVADGKVLSEGVSVLTGPLKTSTAAEKDAIVKDLKGFPPTFRARLDDTSANNVVAVRVQLQDGQTYSIVTGMNIKPKS
ncbi:MAG: hypothetical protein KGL39_27710 [Patescibacteria group bacterium]|nr:hypothetical protein [Patescibacteria group bacterium]